MAQTVQQQGSRLLYRNPDFNSYGVLNVREDFIAAHPDAVESVVNSYEEARKWAKAHPDELAALLASQAKVTPSVAQEELQRTALDINPTPGDPQRTVPDQHRADRGGRRRYQIRRSRPQRTQHDHRAHIRPTSSLRFRAAPLTGLLVPILLLVIWQLVTAAGWFSASQLPPPGDVVTALGGLLRRGELWTHLQASVSRVLFGYLAGAAAALTLGSLVGLSVTARRLLAPTVATLRTVPSLAWVPLLLLWFGIDETPKLLLVAIGAFFPVYTTTASALSHVDPQLLEVGRAYGRHGAALLMTVMLPAAAPELVNGLRLGLANAWLFLVAAELIASSKGLGFLLIDSQNTGRTDVMLLAIVLLAVLGKLSDSALGALEHRMVRRRS
jgi:sulfonate transport system permease protein